MNIPDDVKQKAADYRDNKVIAKTADLYDAVLHGFSLCSSLLIEKEKEIQRLSQMIAVYEARQEHEADTDGGHDTTYG